MSEPLSLVAWVQRRLSQLYGLRSAPSILPFLRPCAEGEREQVLLLQLTSSPPEEPPCSELQVKLPPCAFAPFDRPLSLDALCQVIEGVSHFLLLVDRLRRQLPLSLLELELQAEIDKFVLLAFSSRRTRSALHRLHQALFERVSFVQGLSGEEQERYRTANAWAAQLCWRWLSSSENCVRDLVPQARRFFARGPADKISIIAA